MNNTGKTCGVRMPAVLKTGDRLSATATTPGGFRSETSNVVKTRTCGRIIYGRTHTYAVRPYTNWFICLRRDKIILYCSEAFYSIWTGDLTREYKWGDINNSIVARRRDSALDSAFGSRHTAGVLLSSLS